MNRRKQPGPEPGCHHRPQLPASKTHGDFFFLEKQLQDSGSDTNLEKKIWRLNYTPLVNYMTLNFLMPLFPHCAIV